LSLFANNNTNNDNNDITTAGDLANGCEMRSRTFTFRDTLLPTEMIDSVWLFVCLSLVLLKNQTKRKYG